MEMGDWATWAGAVGTILAFFSSLKLHRRQLALHRMLVERLPKSADAATHEQTVER
ncbi:hypothetical protein OWR29_08915 [Actinoplanes sp. Pm04-4]|uniref:Uncharacterized protein n=1 Tax=Paractinoplanes pyxinae TaxID=2997416 RepID=A0ABT4AWQ9_9ACTN|nr:hypothetical protein [Actinoplanes pyxinae]MCY1138115.1 hypothetical protein [Actinoplanes pyxinae]